MIIITGTFRNTSKPHKLYEITLFPAGSSKAYETSERYTYQLLERVSAGEVLEADSNLSTCINFTVFSFVMAYNNKNVGGLFGCNGTFCVPNQHLWFSKFHIFKNI